MTEQPGNQRLAGAGEILPPDTGPTPMPRLPTPAGAAALAAAQAFAGRATAAATLRAYKADWTHFAQWCATHGFVPVPAAPATIGAYLASLAAPPRSLRAGWGSYLLPTICDGWLSTTRLD